MKKVNELLTCAVMLDSLIVAYLQFVIVVTELKKVLSQEVKCLCSEITTVLSEMNCTKNYGCESHTFL